MRISLKMDCRGLEIPAGYEHAFAKLLEESEASDFLVKVTFENIEKLRSENMNKKFHAMCGELAMKAGDGTKGTKDYIKEMAKSMAVDYFDYPQAKDEKGKLLSDSEGRPVGESTAFATPAQFTMLMDALRLIADQYGYDWRNE